MSAITNILMLARYKAWADNSIFSAVSALPHDEAVRPRSTVFGNMIHTLNHVYVIDAVFQAHLEGREHGYSARNTPHHPPLEELWQRVRVMDHWYVDFAESLTIAAVDVPVHFEFIGGGEGIMTRGEMILHVVNHGSYHRGFVADMMCQAAVTPPATDLPVFLRDVFRAAG